MDEVFLIRGGKTLSGEIEVEASKNAYLPILASSILCDGMVTFTNVPEFSDIDNMCEILKILNVKVLRKENYLSLNTESVVNTKISHELTAKLRASIFLLGALLGKFRQAIISYPGGCKIGTRPIDIHLKAFRSLGVKIVEKHGYIYCNASNMKAGKVVFPSVSVGATESLMMCATLLEGETTLYNVAKEPEIKELEKFLNSLGADIRGAGTDTIKITGVKKLHSGEFTVFPDRIIAGTHLILGALCGKNMTISNFRREDNQFLLNILKESACDFKLKNDKIIVTAQGRYPSYKFVETLPFPYFPTDLQPQLMVLETLSKGTSVIKENLFENRFKYTRQLQKAGADITVKGSVAVVKGRGGLQAADMTAEDLRGGAALVIAALGAPGESSVSGVEHIDRGYYKIEEDFARLGADISRKTQFF